MHSSAQASAEGVAQGKKNDAFIAVMGVTGSGKSSFISLCSGKFVKVGHEMGSCTSVVDVYAYEASPDQTVYLIDTPGFDDTNKSDTEVLGEIATWLGNSYKHKILLNGIIYLHRIIDVRVQGSARKNLMMFRQLCGADALKKVILVTTMWDKAPQEEGVRRERELTQTPEYWGWMVQNGSAFYRHDHTRFSAERIVYRLANNNVPFATDLQKQLIDEQRTLAQTSAGLEISSDLLKEKQKWIREREELEKIMAAAKHEHDHETENFMREERDRTTRMIQKVEADQGALRSNMENLLAQRDARVAEIEKQLEVQKATHEDEVNRFKEQQIQLEKEKAELAGKMEKEESMLDQVQTRNFHQQRTSGLKTIGAMLDEEVGDKLFYSITLYNSKFAGSSRKQQACTDDQPELSRGSAWLDVASIGSKKSWIGCYSNGTWVHSGNIGDQYPDLNKALNSNGSESLKNCVLGPDQAYFAQWKDTWNGWAEKEIRDIFHKHGEDVRTMAFGYDQSYVICFCGDWDFTTKFKCNLKGHYPDLENFIKDNKSMRVVAIALDPQSTTDYILIWASAYGFGSKRIRWICADQKVSKLIEDWWTASN